MQTQDTMQGLLTISVAPRRAKKILYMLGAMLAPYIVMQGSMQVLENH